MTDFFALLQQPRRPWLDLEQLKQAYLDRTREVHPDARPGGDDSGASFAELNQAYRTLQDPRSRIAHLLALIGDPVENRPRNVPLEVAELFPLVAEATAAADAALQKHGAASSALSRSLAQADLHAAKARLGTATKRLVDVRDRLLHALQDADRDWNESEASEANHPLYELYLMLSYVPRWLDEIEEKQRLVDASA